MKTKIMTLKELFLFLRKDFDKVECLKVQLEEDGNEIVFDKIAKYGCVIIGMPTKYSWYAITFTKSDALFEDEDIMTIDSYFKQCGEVSNEEYDPQRLFVSFK